MSLNWESEVCWRRQMRDDGLTPYRDMVKWRRRFWFALLIDAILSALLLIGALFCR